ncbi:hypothetical protein SB780_36325, partial [Burkholderia sp. SIMBA_057]
MDSYLHFCTCGVPYWLLRRGGSAAILSGAFRVVDHSALTKGIVEEDTEEMDMGVEQRSASSAGKG